MNLPDPEFSEAFIEENLKIDQPLKILQNRVISAKSPLLLPTFLNQRDPVFGQEIVRWLPENRKFRSVFETFNQIQK